MSLIKSLGTLLLLLSFQVARAEVPQGYGAQTRGAGSIAANQCLVTNLEDLGPGSLRECLARSGSVWVKFSVSGIITLKTPLVPKADTTIDGRGAGILINGKKMVLIDIRKRNIIINDLKFEILQDSDDMCANPVTAVDAKGCGLGISIKGDVNNIWIHHNQFRKCGEKCIVSGYDAHGKVPDKISISNNFFSDTFFGILVEAIPPVGTVDPIYSRVTIYNNYFKNVFRRSPRISGLVLGHVYNNYMEDWGAPEVTSCTGDSFAFPSSSVGEARLFLERNVYVPSLKSACLSAVNIEVYDGTPWMDLGKVRVKENHLLRGAKITENEPQSVSAPLYKYLVLSISDVVSKTRVEAGPR